MLDADINFGAKMIKRRSETPMILAVGDKISTKRKQMCGKYFFHFCATSSKTQNKIEVVLSQTRVLACPYT